MQYNHLEGLLRHVLLGPTPRVSNSVGLGWGLRICISNKFPGDDDATGLGSHFKNLQLWINQIFFFFLINYLLKKEFRLSAEFYAPMSYSTQVALHIMEEN